MWTYILGPFLALLPKPPAEIEKLFHDESEKGEGIVTVPIGTDRLYEDGLLERSD
jgi:hypothetical protein